MQAKLADANRACEELTAEINSVRTKLEESQHAYDTLEEKFLSQPAPEPWKEAAPTQTREYEELEQKLLIMKRERDVLRVRVDNVLAQCAAAEERTNHATMRCVNLLCAEDAAPRREQGDTATACRR